MLEYVLAGFNLFVVGLVSEQVPVQGEHLILNDYVNLVIHFIMQTGQMQQLVY